MKQLVTILGPTACGKTTLAAQLALLCDGEIISADSRQVYRGMDIGTGKDLDDYHIDGHDIPYHLIDICEPGSKYNLFEYQRDFLLAYNDIQNREKQPILCGGTGLYLESVLRGYQLSPVPQNQPLRDSLEGKTLEELTLTLECLKQKSGSSMHNTTDVDSPQRAIRAIEIETYNLQHPTEKRNFPSIPSLVFGIDIDRETRRERISKRLRERLNNGMVEEIRRILDSGVTSEDLKYYGLEYKFVTLYVIGQISFDQMFHDLEIAIHQFAKRQMTWFRGMERRGIQIHWLDATLPTTDKVNTILTMLSPP
ncbi:MAG: tRNA (adenosine(37)-N6)-dimethylallyltransferase MiaA [Prevotella sp.]|nr:tRNA (adenosine(37)-N6)-dimethylallyltransferase MiaA [Prevotella sp.]